MAEKLKIQP